MKQFMLILIFQFMIIGCNAQDKVKVPKNPEQTVKIKKSDSAWKEELSYEDYCIIRKKGTEVPFTGELLYNSEPGEYHCKACNQLLFSSETKFDSGTGWPSFYQPAETKAVTENKEESEKFQWKQNKDV